MSSKPLHTRIFAVPESHRMHHCSELDGGEVISSWDSPARIDSISTGVASAGQFRAPTKDPLPALSVLHTAEYLSFLEVAHSKWLEAGSGSECAMASVFPADRRSESIPRTIEGQLGYFSFANDCSIGAATWSAALSSASVAASAAAALSVDHEPHEEQRATFALCRPPGHHAMRDRFGGYCYLNNAAVAAQTLLDKDSVRRVFVLDVDYHAGNGTYDIFKDRSDVVFCSIHGDPLDDFPYFFGFADEEGESEGTGYSRNVPLPIGTDFSNYAHVLDDCIRWALEKGCEAMVVSLGLDTFESDPIGNFKFTRGDYFSLGLRLGSLQLPTCFVLEGGYVGREHISNPNSSPLGDLVFDVLNGFESVDTV